MKKLKYLLFLLPFIIFNNVYAQEFDLSSYVTSPNSSGTGKYTGTEIYNSGTANVYNLNTRYNGQLSRIVFNVSCGGWCDNNLFTQGTTYTLTLNMATDDWRNRFGSVSVTANGSSGTNLSNGRVTYVSMKKIYFTFTPTTNDVNFIYVDLRSTNINSTAFTGVSNWNLSSVVLSDPNYCSGSDCYNGGSGSGGSNTNQDIIDSNTENTNNIMNNNNQNTQNIIDNSNSNTQNIIDNDNQNTQKIVDSQNRTNELLGDCYNNYLNPNATKSILESGVRFYRIIDTDTNNLVSIQANGTSTGVIFYQIFGGSWYADDDYYLSGNPTNDAEIYCADGLDNRYYSNIPRGTTIETCYIRIPANRTLSNVQFKPIINKGNIAKPYTPYNVQKCTSKLDTAIENDNQNTNNIINNQNQNTQDIIESNNVCSFYDKNQVFTDNYYLDINGNLNSNSNYGITDYLNINHSTLTYLSSNSGFLASMCFYNFNKVKISCRSINNSIGSIDIPTNSYYVRVSIQKGYNFPQFKICTNGNQALSDDINNLNDSINNSNVDNDTGTSFFDNFNDNDYGLTDIITIPLTTIQGLTSKTCTPIQIPIPFTNSNVSLPCMTEIYQNKFPTIFTLWQTVSFGIIAYFIAIDIFYLVKGFKDPESDKVEVLDL